MGEKLRMHFDRHLAPVAIIADRLTFSIPEYDLLFPLSDKKIYFKIVCVWYALQITPFSR